MFLTTGFTNINKTKNTINWNLVQFWVQGTEKLDFIHRQKTLASQSEPGRLSYRKLRNEQAAGLLCCREKRPAVSETLRARPEPEPEDAR